jgi:hypothetical protein
MRAGRFAAVALVLTAAVGAVSAQGPESFTATASVKNGPAGATFPVRVTVTRWTPENERATVLAAIKTGGPAVAKALGGLMDAGFIEVGTQRTPLKFAGQRDTGGGGRLVTVATATPVLFLGAGLPDAKPKAGFDVALAILDLTGGATGTGELAPAAKIGVNASGALVTSDYGNSVILLKNVARVPPK